MAEQFIVKFDWNIEMLNKIAEEARSIDIADITQVEGKKKELVTLRGKIQAQGQGYRAQAVACNKRVQAEENEYVGIIEPIELEYKEILKKDEALKIIEARKELLPMKKKQLQSLTKMVITDDETILAMDDTQWVAFFNAQFQINEERIQYEEMALRKEKERKEREDEIRAEMEIKAEKEKADLILKAESDKVKAVEDEKKRSEEIDRQKEIGRLALIKKAKDEADELIKSELLAKEEMESDKVYQKFLADNNYCPITDILDNKYGEITLYREVAILKLKCDKN